MEKLPDNPSINKTESQIRGSQGRWGGRTDYPQTIPGQKASDLTAIAGQILHARLK